MDFAPTSHSRASPAGGSASPESPPRQKFAPPPPRPLGPILFRYALREFLVPTALALAGLTAAALTKNLLGYADLIINRGLGFASVASVALYQLVPLATSTFSFAVLIGMLVGLGRLKGDREIQALAVSGVAPRGLVRPAVAFAGAMTMAGLALSLVAAPWSHNRLQRALERSAFEHPGARLRAGVVHEFGAHRLLAREVSSRGDELRGVLVWLPDMGETVFAEHASVKPAGPGAVDLELSDAAMLLSPGDLTPQYLRVGRFRAQLHEAELRLLGSDVDRLEGATLSGLRALGAEEGDDEVFARMARAELQRRFALPVASLVFGLLAVPLALSGRRASRSSGAVAGLLVTIGYYGLLQLANGLLRYPSVPVAAAIWLPNLLGALLAVALLLRMQMLAFRDNRRPMRPRGPSREADGRVPRLRRAALDRYVLGLFLKAVLLSFGILLAAYLIIDVLERLQWFVRNHAHAPEVLRFYGARIPLLASRVVPMSLLAATSLSVSLLAVRGELLGMSACGIHPVRAMAPILGVGLLMVPVDFLLNDAIVPRTNALADRLKVTEIEAWSPESGASTAIWYRAGGQILRAARLAIDVGEARDLTVYELGPQGFPVSRIDAPEARAVGGGVWELSGARRIVISDRGLERAPAPERLVLGEIDAEQVDTMHMSARALAREIRSARAGGYDTTTFRVDLHVKLAAPLACLLLPLIALLHAIRIRSAGRSLLVSGVLGVGYVLLVDVAASLGYGGTLAPSLAGWSPVAALGGFAAWLALRRPR